MDFSFTEEQEMLRKTAHDFLAKECPKSLVRQMEEDEKGYSPELWRRMAEQGWLGLPFPEKYDGGGCDFVDLVVLLEEMGRALLPSPYLSTVVLGGLAILDAGTEEQKQEFLPRIANGQVIMALALTESSARFDAASIKVQATSDKKDYVIDGAKLFVGDAQIADYLLCVTRTKDGISEEGINLFLVDAKSPGITCNPLITIAADKQCEVTFEKVRVPKKNILGEPNRGWIQVQKIMARGAVAHCAQMLGGAQQVLDMSVDYAKQRIAFGHPIGSFQAIQHHCANMASDVYTSRYITYQAAWGISQNLLSAREVSTAKAWVSDAYQRIVSLGHAIHAAIGFTKDHDMQLYFRRAKMAELAFGDGDFHREIVAQELGL